MQYQRKNVFCLVPVFIYILATSADGLSKGPPFRQQVGVRIPLTQIEARIEKISDKPVCK